MHLIPVSLVTTASSLFLKETIRLGKDYEFRKSDLSMAFYWGMKSLRQRQS